MRDSPGINLAPDPQVDTLDSRSLQSAHATVRPAGFDAGAVLCLPSDWAALLGAPALSTTELQALQGMATQHWVPAGSFVFTRQQPATQLYAVLDGSVGLGLARADEPFNLERTVRGPQWLDLASAWLGAEHAQDARVVNDARVVSLPLQPLRTLLMRQPALQERLLVALAGTVHSLTSVTHDLMHKDAERRLAAWLLQSWEPVSEREGRVTLKERKRDIAAQLAITPETLSRMMRQLNRKGLIEVQGYQVRVLDLPALRELAGD